MGTCLSQKEPDEKVIIEKEEILKMKNFTTYQIKMAFFDLHDGEIISYNNVLQGFKNLHDNQTKFNEFLNEETKTLQTLQFILRGVASNPEENDINSSKNKIEDMIRLEGKLKLKKEDLEKLLKEIFWSVLNCSAQLFIQELPERKQKIEAKKQKIFKSKVDKVVTNSVEAIYEVGEQEKTPMELSISFYQLIAKLQYNAAATDGFQKQLIYLALELEMLLNQVCFKKK